MIIEKGYDGFKQKLFVIGKDILFLLFVILTVYAIFVCNSIVNAAEINISYNVNYNNNLEFNWSYDNNINLYLNGELKEENTSIQSYIIQDCQEGDRYKIIIENINRTDIGTRDITIPYKLYSNYTYLLTFIWFILVLCIFFVHKIFIIPSAMFNVMIFWDIFSYADNQYQYIFAGLMFVITFSTFAFSSKVES